jgi:hypothetical protein
VRNEGQITSGVADRDYGIPRDTALSSHLLATDEIRVQRFADTSCVLRPKEGRTGGARGLTLTMRHSAPVSLIWAAHLLRSAAFICETRDMDCSEMRINWVTFLQLKGEPQLGSVTLCGLSTIAGLEQT